MKDATAYGDLGAESCPRAWWAAPTPFNPGAPVGGTALSAFVNQGRWIVSCPVTRCGGAQLASLTDPRFMCVTCANVANGGAWLPVTFPPVKAMTGIVAALDRRSNPVDQNWLPSENVAALLAENVTLGVSK
jgi:hypothetical protein